MTGQRALLNATIGRAAAGLVVAAAALFLAPAAAADPQSDAAGAITAAWEASGGATGPMGASDGGVYPIGAGFGQNFAGGKIFFTPDTGAHFMGGAILQKYQSLGGPADSDLGFPTIDEGPGRVSPESRNSTFSAADKPVIFWTPETGAHVVRGAINAAWDKLGGSAGPLGVPTEDEAYKADVVTQKFTGGELSWNSETKAFTTVPPDLAGQLAGLPVPEDATSAINAARRAAGGALGPLGAKQGQQYAIGADGTGQDFAGGKIFYSPATGANVLTGQVLKKYETVGGPSGDLGFPISSESDGGLPTPSRISAFAAEDKPVIFWTPDYGAVIVRGAMNAAWSELDGPAGPLGAPTADQTENGTVITQTFTGGDVSWDSETNKFTTQPPNLASALSGLSVPGYEPPEAGSSAADSDDSWFKPSWWWLLAIVPLLVLVALVATATLRNRNRGEVDPLDAAFDLDTAHDTAAEAEALRLESFDDRAAGPLADHFGRPSGVPAFGLGDLERDPSPPSFAPAGGEDDVFSELEPDPDAVDTAPTRIPSDAPAEAPSDADPHSGRHAAVELDEPAPAVHVPADVHDEPASETDGSDTGQTAIHLPLGDPYLAPTGYPIKADTKSGLYWAPESALYDHVPAEIYFASEEFARANGFLRAD
ncbi:MAG: LGFP repeat-containing protein [Mycobacterium sp.]